MKGISEILSKQVSSSLLGLFRIVFGGCLVYEIFYYFNIGVIAKGLKAPVVLFPYEGFEWITLLPGKAPELLLFLSLIAAFCIMLGIIYKYAITFFFFTFTYFFMLDKGFYNNHLYLFILLCGLMIFMPADSAYSLAKKNKRTTVPYWTILLLRFQLFVVYFYGGLAKINHDWLILKEPVKSIFATQGYSSPLLINFIAYGGLAFDLSIGFLLCWKPTRKIAVLAVLMFNCTNAVLFHDIGVFPFFMIGATMLFFEPDFFEKWLPNTFANDKQKKKMATQNEINTSLSTLHKALIGTYVSLQLLLPFRCLLITSNPNWYGPGQRFSWRMKIQNRVEKELSYAIFDMDSKTILTFDPHTALTVTQINTLIQDPRMILRFAQFLGDDAHKREMKNVKVKAKVLISYNGRTPQLIIDQDKDLLSVTNKGTDIPKWVLPLADE